MYKESFSGLISSAREFHRVTAPVDNLEREILKDIFGEEFETFFEGKKTKTNLAERLFSLIFDPGLRRKVAFYDTNKGDPNELEKISMFTRQGFMMTVKNRILDKDKKNRPFTIYKVDLADIGLANEALDKNGNKAGDYNLNLTASALKELMEELSSVHGFKIDPKDLIVGRYGGDEFTIAHIGELSQDKKTQEMMDNLIREKIESRSGYFKRKKTVREKLRLKDNKVEKITPPIDDLENKIFFSFLDRGFLLSQMELERERDYIIQSGVNIDEYFRNSFFQNEKFRKLSDDDKIKYLIDKHEEFGIVFHLAKSKGNNAEVKLLRYIENYLLDPLLDEMVITRFDLINHLLTGNFKKAYSFELKIKDTNDELSYIYSDTLISKLWKEKLFPLLNPYIEKGMVSLGRFGGTIFILEKGNGLPENIKKKLKKITGINLAYKNKDIHHAVGYAEVDLSSIGKKSSLKELGDVANKIFNLPTESYLNRSFARIFKNRKLFEKFIFLLKKYKEDPNFKYVGTDYEVMLFARYFYGKRRDIRIAEANKTLDQFKKTAPEKTSLIQSVKKYLTDY